MSSRRPLREAFAERCLAIPGVKSALPYEPGPEALPPLPAVTLLSDLYSQEDRETGPATDNVWGFEVRVYVPLEGYEETQELLDDLVPLVLRIVRVDPDIGGTCEWARMEDPGGVPQFSHDRQGRYAWKTLQLRAEMHET